MRPLVIVILLSACALALPETRAVSNPRTPNQILDAIIERAKGYVTSLGWNVSKRVQNGYSDLPLQVDTSDSSSERLDITTAEIKGLGNMRRSKSAAFSGTQTALNGAIIFENLRILANYSVNFAGIGQAPGDSRKGEVIERIDTMFVDINVALQNLVPQNIVSYKVRRGHDYLGSVTNMAGDMEPIHKAGFRKALRQIVEETLDSNIHVQINKAIQDMKAAAA